MIASPTADCCSATAATPASKTDLCGPPVDAQKSPNVFWEREAVPLARRENLNRHRAAVLWFTGLSGAGKTTLARMLDERLSAEGIRTFNIDGDNLRHGLNGDLKFSERDRQESVRRAGEVAKLGFMHGNVVLVTLISPYARDRQAVRNLFPAGRFFEVHVKCDIDICKLRDPKGLYAKALRGELLNFTGISSAYEAPSNAELVVDTGLHEAAKLVDDIARHLRDYGIASSGNPVKARDARDVYQDDPHSLI